MAADTEALSLLTNITTGVSFSIPVIDLTQAIYQLPGDETAEFYGAVSRIPIEDITDGDITGSGAFDKFMASAKAHLIVEFDENRISGAEYTKAYIALMELCMSNATQFVLQRENIFWESQKSQIEAVTGRATLEKERLNAAAASILANTAKASYAKEVLSLANAEVAYDQGKYQLDNLLPKQGNLLDEQVEGARAQTLDTRTDGVTLVAGVVGKQKDLYTQQITSYQRSDETKTAKILADTWITQKTIDEGLLAPTAFTNAKLDDAFSALTASLNLDGA